MAEATKVFWEGPGESRNRAGVTCKATVRPDGNCVIANHSSHADLRVGDVQLVFQVNRCQVEEITDDQCAALHIVLKEMFSRICAEVGNDEEQDASDAEEQDEPGDDAVEDVDADENEEDATDEELDDGENEYSDSDCELTDEELSELEQSEIADRIRRSFDEYSDESPLVQRYHAHLHEQEVLVPFYRDFDLGTTQDRLIACIIAQGVASSVLRGDELARFVYVCKAEHRSALVKAYTELQRWDAFTGLDYYNPCATSEGRDLDDRRVCILNACSDQVEFRSVAFDGCGDYALEIRRAALERITDPKELQGLIEDIIANSGEDDDELLDPARKRLAMLQRKQKQ